LSDLRRSLSDDPSVAADDSVAPERWLDLARKLQAIASTGLFFGASDFDKERYAEIGEIANHMLADLASVPITRIMDLVPGYAQGYATPLVDVRGALIVHEKVLLVREKSDGLWTLPGGYADVGLSAAQNTAKEIWEEACLRVDVTRLYCVHHKAKHAYADDVRDFYKLYFLCSPQSDSAQALEPKPGPETDGAEFFPIDALPPLSTTRTIEANILLAHRMLLDPAAPVEFD